MYEFVRLKFGENQLILHLKEFHNEKIQTNIIFLRFQLSE